MMDAILAEHQFDPKRALMVGDNILTDIAFAGNCDMRSLMVLGGVTPKDQVYGPKKNKDIVPTYVMNSLGDFAVLSKDGAEKN